jgi:ABC-type taurine transport system substrate-binding protein
MAFKFELADEEPEINNSTVALQAQEMFIGNHKEWAQENAHVIIGLDEETAQKVNDCVKGLDWFRQFDEDTAKDPQNDVIMQFLNKRPDKYIQAAKERLKAKNEIKDSVKKIVDDPELSAS